MSKKTKAVGYVRVASTKPPVNDKSIVSQKEEILNSAARQNIEIVKWFEHVGYGAEMALHTARAYCVSHPEIKYLYITSPDRLTRLVEDFLAWSIEFQEHGVQIKACDCQGETYELERLLHVMRLAAALDAQRRSNRIKAALLRKKLAEKPMEQ